MAKIVIISHYAPSLVNFRGDLIRALIHQGHEVICLAPEEGYESHLREIGANYQHIPLKRTGLNPLKDLHTLFKLRRVLKELKPDIVLSYTVKPLVYGSIAAHMAGVKQIYAMVTGLGYVFVGQSIKQKILTQLVSYLYQIGLKYNRVVFFQNPDDLQLFIEKRIMPKNVKPVLINGSGVNTVRFGFVSPKLSPITFLLIARMIRDKGILEYVEAARQLKKRYSEVRIQLLGPLDVNPTAITRKEIENWSVEGIIDYLGETHDVRPYIAEASVFVLPSYREGTPRSVLEAMSMGRPIITTDVPGCRETVQEGVNGYLVPVKDQVALFKAMERFVLQPELIPEFGLASRRIAEEKYDVHKVNRIILEEMGLLENEALQKISVEEEGNHSGG